MTKEFPRVDQVWQDNDSRSREGKKITRVVAITGVTDTRLVVKNIDTGRTVSSDISRFMKRFEKVAETTAAYFSPLTKKPVARPQPRR